MGASALLTMNALTEGMARGMRYSMLATGDHSKIQIYNAAPPPEQSALSGTHPGLTLTDAHSIRQNIPLAAWVSPSISRHVIATFGTLRDRTRMVGGEAGFLIRDNHSPPIGRSFSELDVQNRNRVCILGGRIYEKLFPDQYEAAIDSTIHLDGIDFRVIGIFPFYLTPDQQRQVDSGEYERKQQREATRRGRQRFLTYDAFPWKNDLILIPITTFQERFKQQASSTQVIGDDMPLDSIQVGVNDPERVSELVDQVRSLLLISRGDLENFEIRHSLDQMENVDKQVAAARLSGSLIAGIGLVVGGVGIANIMLASIADRIREIGIRRAIGARALDIFLQVMMEALLLAFMGGVLGILVGMGIIYVLGDVIRIPNEPVPTIAAVLFSFTFSLCTGFLAGIYPSIKASALSPVEALRYN